MQSGDAEQNLIRTPDRRVRVFVSSTLGELVDERRAVRSAIEQLRLSPIMFEMGARPHPPRALYRSYLAQSDVFVGIYWQRYGWVAPDMTISGLEDEFELADGMPRLMYLKRPAPDIEPRLSEMLKRLQSGDAVSYKSFSTAEELRLLVLDDLALMLTERFTPAAAPTSRGTQAAAPEPTTSLVGRGAEIDEIAGLVRSGRRLITLTGPGGVGKTRVALAVLDQLQRSWTGNTIFVDLSSVTDPQGVLVAIAVGSGIREEGRENVADALVRQLTAGHWLIVIDNFEQVLPAAPQLAALLERCPHLQLLVTSRGLLRLRGETEYRIRPLPVTDPTGSDDSGPAVTLFEERARSARPDFAVDDHNREAIIRLCRRLDGLPLALELAAPQLRLFAPDQLLARIDGWLTGQISDAAYADLPARQRTLRATVEWSHGLLDGPARTLFARLAVFSGGFTLDEAIQVCGWDGLEVTAGLGALLDHSLVSPTTRPDGQPAFAMLETIHAQARSRLAASGEEDSCFAALERQLVTVYRTAAPRLHSADQGPAALTLDARLGDLSATLTWLHARHRPLVGLISALGSCWVWGQLRGRIRHLPDVSGWLQELSVSDHNVHDDRTVDDRTVDDHPVDDNPVDDHPVDDHGPDRAALSWLHMGQLVNACRYPEANTMLRYWLPEMRLLDDRLYAMGLMVFGLSTRPDSAAQVRKARERLTRAVDLFTDCGYRAGLGYALTHLGDASLLDGKQDIAARHYRDALQISHELGDRNLNADAEFHLAAYSAQAANPSEATRHLRNAAPYYLDLAHVDGIARCLAVAAGIALSDGNELRGAELLGTAEALRAPLEVRPWPMIAVLEQRWSNKLRARLGDDFAPAVDRGRQRDGRRELADLLQPTVTG
jgi:predicted ATPase